MKLYKPLLLLLILLLSHTMIFVMEWEVPSKRDKKKYLVGQVDQIAKHFGVTDPMHIDFLNAVASGDIDKIYSTFDDIAFNENFIFAAKIVLKKNQKNYSIQNYQDLVIIFKNTLEAKRREDYVKNLIKNYHLNEESDYFLRMISHGDIGWDKLVSDFLNNSDFMDTLDIQTIQLAREIAQTFKYLYSFNNYYYLMHKLQFQQTISEGKGKIASAA